MRSQEEVKNQLLQRAEADQRIRAVLLQGSRAHPDQTPDELSDYDVVFALDSPESLRDLKSDLSWLDGMGDRVIAQTSDDQLDHDDQDDYGCMTLYADGLRVDLGLRPVERLQNDFQSGDHDPTVVWLDKDDALSVSPQAGHRWLPEKPDQRLYRICCNEFWWVSVYVAKGIWRRQMPYAQEHLHIVRNELLKMAEWYAGTTTDFSVSVGKCGGQLEKYLPAPLWQQLTDTYAAGDYAALWKSLYAATDLFRSLALEVAASLGFDYCQQDDERVSAFLRKIQTSETTRRRAVTCAFTGRRPQSLPWRYDDGHPAARAFARELRAVIKQTYDEGFRIFLCGMAQGVDLLACEQTMILQETECPDIKIIAAIPGRNQTQGWPGDQIERYQACLERCHARRILSQFCSVESYHLRNRWMVDNAGKVIAVWEGDLSGGTGRTVAYARKQGVAVTRLWPEQE